MSELTKNQLKQDNTNSFPNNNTGYITPAILRDFNNNMIDSLVDEVSYNQESSSFNARINALDPSGSAASLLALEAATASLYAFTSSQDSFNSSATASIVALQSFSSSLDATFATDAQLSASVSALSASVAVTDLDQSASIAQLQQFSSSLDNTFATDAELNAATAALELQINTKLSTASYQTDSASFDGRINSIVVTPFLSESVFNSYTASNDSKVNSLISKTGSYATTGSNTFNGSQSITGSVSLTGNITATSASFQYVETIFETASVIYSSGSNQFGDAADDVQTLYGSVRVVNELTASGLNYPTTDGTFTGQVLQTNAAGTLSFGNVSAVYEIVKNGEATTLTVGTLVYASGSQGDMPIVYRADTSTPSKMPVTFVIADAIAAGASGRGVTLGLITGIDMTGYNAGDLLWVDGNGTLTGTRPTGSNDIVQPIAIVTKPGNGGQINILNPGPVLLPNIQQGYVWVGDSQSYPVANPLNQLSVLSSSFATTASFALNSVPIDTGSFATTGSNQFKASQSITGSLRVTTDITSSAARFTSGIVELIPGVDLKLTKIIPNTSTGVRIQVNSANGEIIYLDGLTRVNNNIIVTGSVTSSNGFRGDLIGTASFATTASFALNATSVDTSSLVSTSSFNSYTASNDSKVNSLISQTGSYATTGSNTFTGQQNIQNTLVIEEPANPLIHTSIVQDVLTNRLSLSQAGAAGFIFGGDITASGYDVVADNFIGTASFATTASFALNATPTDVSMFVSESTFNAYTQSNDSVVSALVSATSSYAISSSVAAIDAEQDNKINSLINATSSYITSAQTASMSVLSASYAETSSFALTAIETASVAGDTITFTKGDGSTFPITVATGSLPSGLVSSSQQITDFGFETTSSVNSLSQSIAVTTNALDLEVNQKLDSSSFNSYTQSNDSKVNDLINVTGSFATTGSNTFVGNQIIGGTVNINNNVGITGSLDVNGINIINELNTLINATSSYVTEAETSSFATTGSNTFIGNQNITGALLQSSSLPNEFTRVQIANSNKPFYGEANTLLSLVGDSQGIIDFYADGGNFDTLNIVVNQNDGTTFRDWQGSSLNTWLKIPTNTGANPAPQFKRGLGVTGSVAITGDITARSASFQYVETIYETASVIYSSGSNQLGDELSDVQTLSGSVKVQGELLVNGVPVQTSSFDASGYLLTSSFNSYTASESLNVSASINAATQSLSSSIAVTTNNLDLEVNQKLDSSSFNSYTSSNDSKVNDLIAATSSYAISSSVAAITGDSLVTASISGDTITFTKGNGSTFPIVVPTATGSVPAGTVSSSAQIAEFGYAITGSNTFNGNQTITGSVRVDGDLILDDDGGTTSILLNQKFSTEFLGAFLRWQEASKKVTLEAFESEIQFALSAYSASYDNGFIIDVKSDGTTLSDYNTSFVNQPWLRVPVNGDTNPPVQFPRGLGVTGSVTVSGSTVSLQNEGGNALAIYSGSVQVTSPQGTGFFYSNLPITSSNLRINGTGIIADLYVSGVFAGNSTLNVAGDSYFTGSVNVNNNVNITGSLDVNGTNIINTLNGLSSQTSSYVTESETSSFATTGSNTFNGNQTITGSLRVDGDFFLDDDGGTTSFLMNQRFSTEFLGSQMRWQEAAKKATWDFYESIVDINLSAYSSSYDNGLSINLREDGTTFSDYNTSYVTQSWLRVPVNNNNNPAPQFPRGAGITGSLLVSGSTTLTGSVVGNVNALSVSSNTASLNLNDGNFFTLQLVSGSDVHINPTNIKAGQTISLRLNTTGSGTVSFPSSIKQASGSSYVPTTTTGVDVLTLISFDTQSLYISDLKNFN